MRYVIRAIACATLCVVLHGFACAQAAESPDHAKTVGQSDSAVVQRIEQTLRAPLHSSGLDFVEQPLDQVVKALAEEYRIPILLDSPALDANGLRPDEPVTVHLQGISLKSALRHLLRNLQLTYTIKDEAILITTRDEENKYTRVSVYDVRDLVYADHGRPLEELVKVLNAAVGEGSSIQMLKPGTLIVTMTRSRQEEFRELLTAIRDANRDPPAKGAESEPK